MPPSTIRDMRPKVFSAVLLTVLVAGCAPAEPEPQPVQELTAEADEGDAETQAEPAAPEPTEEAEEPPTPEELVITNLEGQFSGNEDAIDADSRHKLSQDYWLPRAYEYCDLLENDPGIDPITDFDTADDHGIELRILIEARLALCPTDSEG